MSPKVGTTIEEAADQTFLVERTRQPPESENASFEHRFGTPERNPFFQWNPLPHSIRSYRICDAALDGEFRGVFNSKGFIRGTGYLIPDDFMMALDVDETRLIKTPNDSTVIVGYNLAHRNYFHWMTQALPAIGFGIHRAGQDRKMSLALPVLNSWQEESVRLLGYGGIKRVTIDDRTKQYVFDRLEYCQILNSAAAFCLSETAHQTYSRLRQAVERVDQEDKKIYVARTDAPSRRMRNENAVIEEVRKRGFEIVVPGDLTLTEQIRLFRGASLVVGSHGAGMTNIVFCEPGTIVYELVPDHYRNVCFCNLAHICRLRYWADSFVSEGDGLPNLREWESDTRLVIERLDEIENIYADLQEEAKRQTISAMDFLRGKPGQVIGLESTKQPLASPVRFGLLRRMFRGRS